MPPDPTDGEEHDDPSDGHEWLVPSSEAGDTVKAGYSLGGPDGGRFARGVSHEPAGEVGATSMCLAGYKPVGPASLSAETGWSLAIDMGFDVLRTSKLEGEANLEPGGRV